MFATVRKSEEYKAYCELQLMAAKVARMNYLLRAYEADDALKLEAAHIFKMINELRNTIDDMFLDGYFKQLNEKFEKEGL